MALLEITDVTKSYGAHRVLEHVTLEVESHQVICLIGASGSGKSTLLRCISALEAIDSGEIRFAGEVVSGEGVNVNKLRQRVGMVFQSYNLFPNRTVLENVTLAPMKVKGVDRAAAVAMAEDLLARVGLDQKVKSYPDQLSGGQQQRVAIARALAMSPDVLLLDEVTSALDPELVSEVLDLIRELAEGGMTMLIATHEMSFAREVSNLICFLHDGAVLEKGPPAALFTAPVEAATRSFLRRVTEAGRM